MHTKNTIMKMLNQRGFKEFKPTEELLTKLDLNPWRFKKIIENKIEMTLTEANGFAIWLGVTVDELSLPDPDL